LESSIHPDPRIASYQLGTMMPISHPERQELLEIPTTSERLDRVLLYLAGETGLLRHMLGLGRMGA
jgi:Lon protease-like protein